MSFGPRLCSFQESNGEFYDALCDVFLPCFEARPTHAELFGCLVREFLDLNQMHRRSFALEPIPQSDRQPVPLNSYADVL